MTYINSPIGLYFKIYKFWILTLTLHVKNKYVLTTN